MTPLAELFPSLLEKLPEASEFKLEVVRIAWRHCLGEKIRNAANPVNLRGGVLRVRVADPQWKTTLESMKPELISRINVYLKKKMLRDLKIEL